MTTSEVGGDNGQKQSAAQQGVSATAWLAALAGTKLLLHLATHWRYGYERDELYFVACGEHLAWGYVDHPPLVPWLTRLAGETLGYSLFALRLLPVAALTAALVLVGMTAQRLGGGRFAQGLAALAFLLTPLYLRLGTFLNIPSFQVFFWSLLAFLLVVLIQRDEPRLWLAIGVVAGVGLLNKHSMGLWGAALIVGLALTPHRRFFLDKRLWLGGMIACGIFLPNLVWQVANGFPTVEFVRNLNRGVMAKVSPVEFLAGQMLYMQPFVVLICLAGLAWYLFSNDGRPYRLLGWVFLTTVVVLLVTKSKVYYLAPAYPMLMAAGGVAVERWKPHGAGRWLKPAAVALLIAGCLPFLPLALPILPLEVLDRAVPRVTLGLVDDPYELTEHFHKELGWENQAAVVGCVFQDLTEQERAKAAVLAGNYGEAGAIDLFGPQHGLPAAICGHHSYYLWGPRNATGEVVIAFGVPRETLEEVFARIRQAATIQHPQALPLENDVPVYVCTEPRLSMIEAWPKFRQFVRIN